MELGAYSLFLPLSFTFFLDLSISFLFLSFSLSIFFSKGLIFGRIMMIEQEYRTSLDVWAPHLLRPQPSLSAPYSSPTLSSASLADVGTSMDDISSPKDDENADEMMERDGFVTEDGDFL